MAERVATGSTGTGHIGTGNTGTDRVTSPGEARDAVRGAHEAGTPLRIVGSGTWLQGGRPVRADRRLDLSGLSGIVEYVPGDLTLTAHAGTTLEEIGEAARRHGQWFPLDPFGAPNATLGATLATASSGPTGGSGALPRDLTMGLTFVSGDGMLVRGGGRVVKNVAGFDLVRLSIGAWGTLGVIVEATVRLRARPVTDRTVALELPADVSPWLDRLRAAPIEPLGLELVSPALAARLDLGDTGCLLVRLAGNEVAVRHQHEALGRLGTTRDVPDAVWDRLRASDPHDAVIVRVSRRPTELARLWQVTGAIPGVDAHASVTRGVVRLRLPVPVARDALDGFADGDRCIVEQGPDLGRRARDGNAALGARLRLAFDPGHILNPGILGEATP